MFIYNWLMLVIHWNKIGKTPRPLVSTYQKYIYIYIYIYIHIYIIYIFICLSWTCFNGMLHHYLDLFGWKSKKRSLANTSHLAVSCSSINSTFSSKLDVLHTPIFGSEILSMVWTQNIVFVRGDSCLPKMQALVIDWNHRSVDCGRCSNTTWR